MDINTLFFKHNSFFDQIFHIDTKIIDEILVYKGYFQYDIYNSNFGYIYKPLSDYKIKEEEIIKYIGKLSLLLTEENINDGYLELLVRNGYKASYADTFMVYPTNINEKQTLASDIDIKVVTENNIAEYKSVLNSVFSDSIEYHDLLNNILIDKIKSPITDFTMKLFLIYENGTPVAGSGIFYSKSLNMGYLHDDGVLESSRNKGYHKFMIKYRTNFLLELGITNIYSIVDFGSVSFENMIKSGFNFGGQIIRAEKSKSI